MRIQIRSCHLGHWSELPQSMPVEQHKVQLVLVFGASACLNEPFLHSSLQQDFPAADIVYCSTSGEIFGQHVMDSTVTVTAIQFEKTTVKAVSINVGDHANSYEAGMALISALPPGKERCHIMVFSDGTRVNGSDLLKGMNLMLEENISLTGGLAGDGDKFVSACTGLNSPPVPGTIVAIAFYSSQLHVSWGSVGGCDRFGPPRTITRSAGNRLYEINGENALALYKKYLGPYASELPGAAFYFPLSIELPGSGKALVRTIVSIDPNEGCMVFAGDMPEGAQLRFMRMNLDKVIEAAEQAATYAVPTAPLQQPSLSVLISCIGRKIVLGNRVNEEVEAVAQTLGEQALLTGFYSYGEIAPFAGDRKSELHNQTMTITTFTEN